MDIRRVVKQAKTQGWLVEKTSDGLRFMPPAEDRPAVQWHRTTSDRRAERNFLAALRASGFIDREGERRLKKERRSG